MQYPQVRRSDHEDEIHGRTIPDPYRWQEDPDSEETKAFVTAQNECAEQVFSQIPFLKDIQTRLTQMFDYEKYSTPTKHANQYFFYKNDGLQNQFVLYRQQTLDEDPIVVLDPNTFAEDGTAALGATKFSKAKTHNLYLAYGVSRGGSDWQTIKVKDILKDQELEDTLQWVKFSSIAWLHDDSGFFYGRFPAPKGMEDADPNDTDTKLGTETDLNTGQQIWFHKLGTSQDQDHLIYEFPSNSKYYLGSEVTEDGQHLIITLFDGCKNANMVHLANLDNFTAFLEESKAKGDEKHLIPVQKLVDNMDSSYEYIVNIGSTFFFQTNLEAPRERVVKCNIEEATAQWEEVIPEQPDAIVLKTVFAVNGAYLVTKFIQDVKNVLCIYNLDGSKVADIPFPGVGTAIVSGNFENSEVFFKFVSFLYPGSIYKFDVSTLDVPPVLIRETKVSGFDPSLFEAKQVFYPSKDGTKIPMFLVSKKDISYDGSNPVYLYGYGGFNINLLPSFSVSRLVFIQNFDGVLALPNLRGGGEYGEDWHQAGTFDRKQNVFDDFHAAAEYLIAENIAKPEKIAIHGGSNGGLLVGACANQRPDLYGCGVAAVGVMDMIRFHKFTCGHGWRSDYGDPDVEDNFKYIYAYSPLHNIPENVIYPAMLLTTGDHDDRVVPNHSYKFISELQHKLGSVENQRPLICRIDTKAGHGAGKPTSKVIEESAVVYAFIAWSLKASFRQ